MKFNITFCYVNNIFNKSCSVHLRLEEKIALTAGREGGLQNLEVHGILTLKVNNEKYGKVKIAMKNNDNKGVQIQVSWQFIPTNHLCASAAERL